MKFWSLFYLLVFFQTANVSCCSKPDIIHIVFCDFLNDVSNESDRAHGKISQEKSLHYLIAATSSACWKDSILLSFIKNDDFIQKEMNKKYYRLTITFYKKSRDTEALMKMRSSRFLDYCEKDIVVEYEWIEGKMLDHPFYYKNGIIEGAEDIQLIDSIKEEK
jgi:hypothetical protein